MKRKTAIQFPAYAQGSIWVTALFFLNIAIPYLGMSQIKGDSLGYTKDGERILVNHKVGEKETVFSIAQRYGSSMYDVIQANPGSEEGLKMGQLLKVPYGKPFTPPAEILKSAQANAAVSSSRTHKVRPSETIFSISRMYEVSVADLRTWNGLRTDDIKIDQILRVSPPPSGRPTVAAQASNQIESTTVEANARPEPARMNARFTVDRVPVSGNSTKMKVEEKGIAELITGSDDTAKFLALHKTAPTGTVIQVVNPMNNVSIFVRVVGQLPATGDNDKVLIKLSKAAYDRLNAIDKKFLVQLSYFE